MSQPVTFDTHRFVKRMTETGMSEKMAEALADEHVQLLEGNLATRQQLENVNKDTKLAFAEIDSRLMARIAEVEAKLTGQIKEVEAGLTIRMAEIESGLLRWMVGLLIAQGGVVVSLIKLI